MIPLGTDAPIYHYPFATIVLIVANVVVFAATGAAMDPEAIEPWALSHGQGLHPVEWVTSNFVHGGFGHLIGNMIFLWGFGLVVEGKLGWWKYLLVYLGIGVTQCALEQTFMLGYDGAAAHQEWVEESGLNVEEFESLKEDIAEQYRQEGHSEEEVAEGVALFESEFRKEVSRSSASMSFGASAILYGLLAICLVWAPKNEVTILVIILYRAAVFEVTIMTFACWYIGIELFTSSLTGFSMGSATLHAMGAVLGFGVGVALFKMKLVDCEDWDLFAVMSGHYGPWARDKHGYPIDREPRDVVMDFEKPKKQKKKGPSRTQRNRKLEAVAGFVEAGDFMRAVDELHNHRRRDPEAMPDEETMKRLAIGLAKEGLWEDAVPIMEEFIAAFPDAANGMRLRLANACLEHDDSAGALEVLGDVDRSDLSEAQQKTLKKLLQAARG
ncbi:MAG: rhomboid family intramembrane serine protease [Planctomycetota bacterium]|nr:rhomboid family intramembrane serine protease [Planctomycetota bacterium]